MIIDSSAMLAAMYAEPERDGVLSAFENGEEALAGSPTLFESELVICRRHGSAGVEALRGFVREFGVTEINFNSDHRREATEAFLRFGKGRHPAHLNFGDCLTYAIAKVSEQPLLCVGNDFAKTDLELVLSA